MEPASHSLMFVLTNTAPMHILEEAGFFVDRALLAFALHDYNPRIFQNEGGFIYGSARI